RASPSRPRSSADRLYREWDQQTTFSSPTSSFAQSRTESGRASIVKRLRNASSNGILRNSSRFSHNQEKRKRLDASSYQGVDINAEVCQYHGRESAPLPKINGEHREDRGQGDSITEALIEVVTHLHSNAEEDRQSPSAAKVHDLRHQVAADD